MVQQPHQYKYAPGLLAGHRRLYGLRGPEPSGATPPRNTGACNRLAGTTRGSDLANDTIRRKLAALSSLYAYLCDRNAVLHNPVLGVKRPRSMNREGVTPGARRSPGRMLLAAPPEGTLKGKRDRAILATLLYHGLRCEELCTLTVGSVHQREGYCISAWKEGGQDPLSAAACPGPAAYCRLFESRRARGGPERSAVPTDQEQPDEGSGQAPASGLRLSGYCQALCS